MYTTKTNNKLGKDLFPQIDGVLNQIFNTNLNHLIDENKIGYTQPSANVREFKEKFIIDFAIPGLEKGDIKIKVDKSILSVSSEREQEADKKYRITEFKYGKFDRKFKLPQSADSNKIAAELSNGVLSITINKKKDSIDKGPKEIKIS